MSVHDCLCFQIGVAHRRLSRLFDAELACVGLTVSQAHAVMTLVSRDGRPCKELAAELAIDAGTVTALIDRLEKLGWVERRPDPADRRTTRLFLTPSARARQGALVAALGVAGARVEAALPEGLDRGDWCRIVSELTAAVGEAPARRNDVPLLVKEPTA